MIRLLDRLTGALLLLGRRRCPRFACEDPRILIIRRNRMGDMICTLPLLRALRARFPAAHIVVACDVAGEAIARACSAVNEVIPLRRGTWLWLAPFRYFFRWQDFDWVIAAKAGFDSRLGRLTWLTHAARRIGYDDSDASDFYTDPVKIPANIVDLHQVEATLGLLAPLGVASPADLTDALQIDLPDHARVFTENLARLWRDRVLVLINLSSTTPMRFAEEDWTSLIGEVASRSDLVVGLVGLPSDLARAQRFADATAGRARVLATPGPLELAALLKEACLFVTAEGGAAHLAATVGAPAVVLWSEGPFEKWRSRGEHHTFVQLKAGEAVIPLERVRSAMAPYLERCLASAKG